MTPHFLRNPIGSSDKGEPLTQAGPQETLSLGKEVETR